MITTHHRTRQATPARVLLGVLFGMLVTLVATACATTGATLGSGVGDSLLGHPPYYAGVSRSMLANDAIPIAHLPIVFQAGAAQQAIFDPRARSDSPVATLLAEMNAYLDSLARDTRLSVPLRPWSSVAGTWPGGTPPDVRFGCLTFGNLPGEECAARGDSALGRRGQRMRLEVGRPSTNWVDAVKGAARLAGAARILVITLEVGQYLPRQVGWRGDKSVELGTGYTAQLPWLTSLETPVLVLQLTGALIDTSGRAVRAGAEGILATRTRLLVSAVGGQELLQDRHVADARSHRRDDLLEKPLAWKTALRLMLSELTGRSVD
jgi:hypothetical protein